MRDAIIEEKMSLPGPTAIRHVVMAVLTVFLFDSFLAPCLADPTAFVSINRDEQSPIVGLRARMIVPPKPTGSGWLYIWLGLQPQERAERFYPIDNGVLQPVLTFETDTASCAPGTHPSPSTTWWISAQYVNTVGHYSGYMGCFGGPILSVDPGDVLLLDISLIERTWVQTVIDLTKEKSVTYQINLHGQSQNYANFEIEPYGNFQVADITYEDIEIAFAEPKSLDCSIEPQVGRNTITPRYVISRGQKCYIDQIVLRQADTTGSK